MKFFCALVIISLCITFTSLGQVGINTDNTSPDPSAILDAKSTNKGFLPPRMTQSQISLIPNPADGLMVYCTTDSKIYIYIAILGQWKEVSLGTASIQPPFVCGNPLTIRHIAGSVAAVDKTVTYGTVSNIPGETSKCWIAQNLGSDHQATAVDDATEASAGWYWQFNRKQGYKHDGSTRTPNTSWIIGISENSDWIAANDPCTIELGTGWRIPTYAEWYHVKIAGGWNNWTILWNSGLKLHAAGILDASTGARSGMGTNGFYFSSYNYSPETAIDLQFNGVGYVNLYNDGKALGMPLRCIKE